MRKFVTKLDQSGAILPVVLLEATVTGGRTYQAYKRDGFVEARERVTEESLGAVFWLFGATMFGKLFDKIGRKFFKMPKKAPDVGRDLGRTAFDNYIERAAKVLKLSPEAKETLKSKLANFSVGKTAASLIMACLFIGYVVPKLNQGITKNLFGKMNASDPNHQKGPDPYKTKLTLKDARAIFSAKDVSINAVENFKASKGTGLNYNAPDGASKANPSFKGSADSLLRIVQNFEENAIWKLMGTDVGTVTGRTANARNNDERVEIMFRDLSSIYFYCFSMPAIVKFMNKKDAFGGLNTKLNPMSSMEVHNKLINQIAKIGVENVDKNGIKDIKAPLKDFKEMALGKDLNKELYEKIFKPVVQPAPKKYLFGLFTKNQEPEKRIIKLSEFEAKIDAFAPQGEKENLKKLAREMARLMQPERYFPEEKISARILTEAQVEDVLRGGYMRKPEVMSEVLKNIFKEDSIPFKTRIKNLYNSAANFFRETPVPMEKAKNVKNPLINRFKYISLETLDDRRQRILDYVEAIVKDAEKTGEVSAKRMLELNKRNMRRNGLFMGLAMGVSALFLSTIIPKIQYYITFLRTGKNSFPGTENMEQKKA